ncbi:hypothetical protein L13192_11501 [Pyrenophora tritici-repentis]|uniref:Uncharacterized protein n=1 Tax=Pyrenophora tritici-repentis TaxID=45151 RepID=A0A922NJZ6_9PLEO|nr:hypothetical protein Ptr86124_005432 [Pyrenophora tritici-repentis]KAI1664317.1 hypothetical protein L13192_11501 [Pyrenophora tritici-repentis]KAI1678411.1 hypothetical protein KJE20_12019 [Pyrenophora tritici-repentis]
MGVSAGSTSVDAGRGDRERSMGTCRSVDATSKNQKPVPEQAASVRGPSSAGLVVGTLSSWQKSPRHPSTQARVAAVAVE